MREFWVSSGHHLARRGAHGGLVVTPELIMAWLARPELAPPEEACDAERALHATLLKEPLRPVSPQEIESMEDADARENWTFMIAFRDQLLKARSLEAAYLELARKGAHHLPPIMLGQLCHLVLRNALEGCDDPFILRGAELFFRPQKAALRDGLLLLADSEVVEAQQAVAQDAHHSPLTALLSDVPEFGNLDVMDGENAWTYWSRSDAHSMIMNLGGDPKARTGLAQAIERWIGHMLQIEVRVEPLARMEDDDWRWFVGLDAHGTRIGNALWNGESVGPGMAERIVTLMRLTIVDESRVRADMRGKPVYLIGAMDHENVWRMKPQNLLVGLPLIEGEPS